MIRIVREGGNVTLGIKRDGKDQDVSIAPIVPKLIADVGPNQAIAVDSLGFAVPVTWTVDSVEYGSPAAAAGLMSGDELISVEYLLNDAQKKDNPDLKKRPTIELVEDEITWPEVASVLQGMSVGTKLKFKVQRDSVEQSVEMATVASDKYFQGKRGISLTYFQKHYKSPTWGDAFSNGFKQVVNDVKRVGKTLAKLIKGKISPKNLGGPGTIAMAATSEATQSTSRLLLFLTFLSANLAIVNFLPIPILDGGHMLFLAYEGIFSPAGKRTSADHLDLWRIDHDSRIDAVCDLS